MFHNFVCKGHLCLLFCFIRDYFPSAPQPAAQPRNRSCCFIAVRPWKERHPRLSGLHFFWIENVSLFLNRTFGVKSLTSKSLTGIFQISNCFPFKILNTEWRGGGSSDPVIYIPFCSYPGNRNCPLLLEHTLNAFPPVFLGSSRGSRILDVTSRPDFCHWCPWWRPFMYSSGPCFDAKLGCVFVVNLSEVFSQLR